MKTQWGLTGCRVIGFLCLVGCIVIHSGLVSQRETETVKAMKELDFESSVYITGVLNIGL